VIGISLCCCCTDRGNCECSRRYHSRQADASGILSSGSCVRCRGRVVVIVYHRHRICCFETRVSRVQNDAGICSDVVFAAGRTEGADRIHGNIWSEHDCCSLFHRRRIYVGEWLYTIAYVPDESSSVMTQSFIRILNASFQGVLYTFADAEKAGNILKRIYRVADKAKYNLHNSVLESSCKLGTREPLSRGSLHVCRCGSRQHFKAHLSSCRQSEVPFAQQCAG
jgi:hypothetical protein